MNPAPGSGNSVESVVVLAPRHTAAGPGLSPTGGSAYAVTRAAIVSLPRGESTPLSDVLTQLPGVTTDQNQKIHIRDTEGPQFQYDIDGMLVPFDINTTRPSCRFWTPASSTG